MISPPFLDRFIITQIKKKCFKEWYTKCHFFVNFYARGNPRSRSIIMAIRLTAARRDLVPRSEASRAASARHGVHIGRGVLQSDSLYRPLFCCKEVRPKDSFGRTPYSVTPRGRRYTLFVIGIVFVTGRLFLFFFPLCLLFLLGRSGNGRGCGFDLGGIHSLHSLCDTANNDQNSYKDEGKG